MRLDGFGIFVKDMRVMIRFYRDVPGFEIKEEDDAKNVYSVKDNTLFMHYRRKDFEDMTHTKYEYVKGLNGYSELAILQIWKGMPLKGKRNELFSVQLQSYLS